MVGQQKIYPTDADVLGVLRVPAKRGRGMTQIAYEVAMAKDVPYSLVTNKEVRRAVSFTTLRKVLDELTEQGLATRLDVISRGRSVPHWEAAEQTSEREAADRRQRAQQRWVQAQEWALHELRARHQAEFEALVAERVAQLIEAQE